MCFKTVTNVITMYIIYIVFTRDKCLFRLKKTPERCDYYLKTQSYIFILHNNLVYYLNNNKINHVAHNEIINVW